MLDELVVQLAAMAGYLGDGPKQGNSLSSPNWSNLMIRVKQHFGFAKIPVPDVLPYSDENATGAARKRPCSSESYNILDFLRFDVAAKEAERIKTELSDITKKLISRKDIIHGDAELKALHDQEQKYCKTLPAGPEKTALETVLSHINTELEIIIKEWKSRSAKNKSVISGTPSADFDSDDFHKAIEGFRTIFDNIHPPQETLNSATPCHLVIYWQREQDRVSNQWSLLKASCLYERHPSASLAWKVAFQELCQLKAGCVRARGNNITSMIEESYSFQKFDIKSFDKHTQSQLALESSTPPDQSFASQYY